jgi:hypothetical protein
VASEQVLDIPVRRHVLTSERPFQVVLDGIGPYTRSKIAAELVARDSQQAGSPVVITYPAVVQEPHYPTSAIQRDCLCHRAASTHRVQAATFLVNDRSAAGSSLAVAARKCPSGYRSIRAGLGCCSVGVAGG